MSTFTETIGFDPESLSTQLIQKGVTQRDAASLITNLIAVNLGLSPRHFVYSTTLPSTDPANCPPTFARSFAHQDWVDGESVVQASESADDKGFNWRFNAIAADLDALNADTKNLYQCLVTIRTELVQALQDVAAELNRLDADVASALRNGQPFTPWNVNVAEAPQFLGVRDLDGSKVTMWKTGQGVVVLPGVDTVGLQDTVNQRIATGGLVQRYAGTNQEFAADVANGTPVSGLIAKYGDQPLGDGRTVAQGLSILPPTATFNSVQSAVDSVNTAEQGVLRSTVGGLSAVNAITGVTSEGTPLTDVNAGVIAGSVAGAPPNLAAGMQSAGISNVGELAGMNSADLKTRLGQQGIQLSDAQVGEISARAQMIAGLGR